MNTTHTNIILMNIPIRYDLPDSSSVNKTISVMNRKLLKLVKAFPHTKILETLNNMKIFTTHGLRRNNLGKSLVNLQLAHLLFTTFRPKELHPIPLGGYETFKEENLSCDVIQKKSHNRSIRTKKNTNNQVEKFFMVNVSTNKLDSSSYHKVDHRTIISYLIIQLMIVINQRNLRFSSECARNFTQERRTINFTNT
jgi:hypothetical protein